MASNSKGNFSWDQFWSYYNSDNYTDELRKETLDGMNLPSILDSAPQDAQIEIMLCAPEEILELQSVRDNLHPVARAKLKIPTTDDDIKRYIRRNWDKVKQ